MVMRILLIVLFCVLPIFASASDMKAIFFQPRESDIAIPAENWPTIFSLAKKKGFNTLVIQWTAFGDVFSSPKNQAWLKDRMLEVSKAELKLIVGLGSGPDTFTRLKQPPSIVGNYFRKVNETNLVLARYWVMTLPKDAISAWYLPLEIDDRQWRELPARAELIKYLERQTIDLNGVAPLPVYASSFFAGNMTPERYAAMLESVEAQSKVRFWIQDGAGTNKLMTSERDSYIGAITNCEAYAVSGMIYELFKQTQVDGDFAAKPLSPLQMSKALQQRSPCQGDSLFFALNYLIDFSNPK
jgi:hypothetical protein